MSVIKLCNEIGRNFDQVEIELRARKTISGHEIFELLEDKLSDQLWVLIDGEPQYSMHLEDDSTLYTYTGPQPTTERSLYLGTTVDVSYRPFSFKTK